MEYTLQPIRPTKELILSRVSEETIMEHYLGVPVKKGLFRSPLRKDNHPTCTFYRSSKTGELLYKDFGSDHSGNCISVVMYKFNCSYGRALGIIANDFGIIEQPKMKVNAPKIKYTGNKLDTTSDSLITVEIKDFEDYELKWWSKFGITEKTLKKFRVFSCKNVFLNGELFHLHKDKQLIFGYYGGIRENIERWRIYFVGNKKHKFLSNWKANMIQGAHLLPKTGGDALVITKSLKDSALFYELGIPAIAPCSENLFLSKKQYEKLKTKFKHMFLVYDLDMPGVHAARKIKKEFPDIKVLLLPKNKKAKDCTDYVNMYGKEEFIKLVNSVCVKYELPTISLELSK